MKIEELDYSMKTSILIYMNKGTLRCFCFVSLFGAHERKKGILLRKDFVGEYILSRICCEVIFLICTYLVYISRFEKQARIYMKEYTKESFYVDHIIYISSSSKKGRDSLL